MPLISKPTALLARRWVFSCLLLKAGFLASCQNQTIAPQPPQVNSPSHSDSAYLGLSPEAATAKATHANLRSRIVRVDGIGRPVTKDYRPTRLNFTIEDGKVVKVNRG